MSGIGIDIGIGIGTPVVSEGGGGGSHDPSLLLEDGSYLLMEDDVSSLELE